MARDPLAEDSDEFKGFSIPVGCKQQRAEQVIIDNNTGITLSFGAVVGASPLTTSMGRMRFAGRTDLRLPLTSTANRPTSSRAYRLYWVRRPFRYHRHLSENTNIESPFLFAT